MQQFFHHNGYIVLSSITYGPKFSRMKQDNQLHHNLSGTCMNSSNVDDDFMSWVPKSSGQLSFRYYSTNISHNLMMSLQQDICHYISYLGLEDGLCVQSAIMNIRIQGSQSEKHQSVSENQYVAIFPYYFSNKSYSVSILKVSL